MSDAQTTKGKKSNGRKDAKIEAETIGFSVHYHWECPSCGLCHEEFDAKPIVTCQDQGLYAGCGKRFRSESDDE